MKKRVLISIALTIAGLVLSNKYWLIIRHLPDRTSVKFEFLIFIILLVLIFLLVYKLTDYMANFKTIKGKSRIDIIFLTIFFVFLFIPMTHINQEKISVHENRRLAQWKPLIVEKGVINYNFGNDFNSWFNDRFYLRKQFIYLYYLNLKYYLSGKWLRTEQAVYNKKTNWAFHIRHMQYYPKFFTEDFADEAVKQFDILNDFCKENNIHLYVLVVPYSTDLYYEETPDYLNLAPIQEKKNEVIYKIKDKSKANIIYPYKELKEKSANVMVSYKQEHHWTDEGALIGYNEMMKEIKKDFPNIRPVKKSDYIISKSRYTRGNYQREYTVGANIANNMPFLKKRIDKIQDVDYTYYDHKKEKALQCESADIKGEKTQHYTYPYGNKLKVLQTGTSMNDSLRQFTLFTFNDLKYLRLNNIKGANHAERFKLLKHYKNSILEYKPDIIILCITPLNIMDIVEQGFDEDK
ncbi:hypothetical protein J6S88_01675 [bacterium]|nr:hypothetical protein [bacterium]